MTTPTDSAPAVEPAPDLPAGPPAAPPRPPSRFGTAVVLMLILVPCLIAWWKHTNWPGVETLTDILTLEWADMQTMKTLDDVLLVPAAGIVVVLIRLVLGLRMLGPFRPILIAIGFAGTGIAVGSAFLGTVVVAILLLRPRLQRARLTYFGRLMVMLSGVVILQAVVLMIASRYEGEAFANELMRTAYFPIVVLCLAADGFAEVINDEGTRSALWRMAVTIVTAIAIGVVRDIPGHAVFILEHPEILLTHVGIILLIARHAKWRLLGRLNPTVTKAATEGGGSGD